MKNHDIGECFEFIMVSIPNNLPVGAARTRRTSDGKSCFSNAKLFRRSLDSFLDDNGVDKKPNLGA
jgi:hypothetical protein